MDLNEKGFTLLEIVTAAAIISLLAVITVPAMDKFTNNYKLKADAQKLAGIMRLARQEAITSGQARTVIFYPDGRYKVYNQGNRTFTSYCLNSGVDFLGKTTFKSSFLNYPACTFSSLGNPICGGTITLRAGKENKLYIITNPVQGRIRISSDPPASWD
jgi:prepilin-type N-terminal cleavage/methylation domain-containing protein